MSETMDFTNLSMMAGLLQVFKHHAVLAVLLSIVVLLIVYVQLKGDGMDPREPPIANPKVPWIGHLLGMKRHQFGYFSILQQRTRDPSAPAFTMKLFRDKTYVVTSPGLANVALRSKALSMEPLSALTLPALLGISQDLVRRIGMDDKGHWIGTELLGVRRNDFSSNLAMHTSKLSAVTKPVAAHFSKLVNEIGTEPDEKNIYHWLRDGITYATAMGLYGPKNPVVLDGSLLDDFWAFDKAQLALILNFYPAITASEGLAARERIVAVFKDYLEAGHDKLASPAVQSTINIMKAQSASIDDMARIETFGISVATINTTPTAIWLVINVLANRPLLSTLRDELQAVATTLPTDDSTKSSTKKIELDLTNAAETCPILYAAYQEALRIGSIPTCNRSVLEDTTLTDPLTGQSVLMKKDVRVSIPTFLLHNQPKIWGKDVSVFNVDHFKDIKERSKDKEQKLAFVPYGGGVHLCPGRHLAQQEIMAVAALIVQALDFEMGDGGGEVVVPKAAARFGVLQPEKPFVLKVKRREGFEMVEWAIRM